MKLNRHIHVVGGGRFGFGLSGVLDCHVYVLNGGSELALVDVGPGLAPKKIRKIIWRTEKSRAWLKRARSGSTASMTAL